MRAKNRIPKSRAKTAYGLLSAVCRLILDEPKRYDQSSFIIRRDGAGGALSHHHASRGVPACGTVGCVAGWVATLKHPKPFGYGETSYIAKRILGLSDSAAFHLFDGGACSNTRLQTKQHAKAGVAHIRRFLKEHARQLKAKRV